MRHKFLKFLFLISSPETQLLELNLDEYNRYLSLNIYKANQIHVRLYKMFHHLYKILRNIKYCGKNKSKLYWIL